MPCRSRVMRTASLSNQPPLGSRVMRAFGKRSCSARIKGGYIELPQQGGLGIELDMDAVERAHQLYLQHGLGARDDAIAMQYLVPGWRFDNKRPCMVR